MIPINTIQFIMKFLTSILFRLLLIVYSLFIIFIQENIYSIVYYIIGAILYFTFYILLLSKNKALVRLVNDYIFIFFILYGKDILEFYNVALLLFPLLNSPNHTQQKRHPFILLTFTILIYGMLDFSYKQTTLMPNQYIYVLIGFSSLIIISLFEYFRSNISNKLLKIYKDIDKIVSEKKQTSQVPDIYNLIKNKFREDLKFNIEQIISLQYDRNHLIVKNSSSFVHSCNLEVIEEALKETNIAFNLELKINENEKYYNICLKVEKFIFIFITSEKNKSIFQFLYSYEILMPILKKIIDIIQLEDILNKQKYKVIVNLNQKSHYVNEIMKSTHYLSNEFSPILSYFKIKEKYETLDDEIKKEKLFSIMINEEKRALISLDNIKNKSLSILDKEDNPFIPKQINKIKYKQVFMLVKNIWLKNFYENEIESKNFENNFEKFVYTDSNSLEFIFTDITENMRKYSLNYRKIIFDFENGIEIKLFNDIKNIKREILELAKNFNNNDRIEINKRNSFGLSHIKELTNTLNIETNITIDENKKLFIMTLTFGDNNEEKNINI